MAAVKSGDACEECSDGYYIVVNTLPRGESRIQYLACRSCKHRPENNKRILKADDPSPRFSRDVVTT